MSKKIWFVLLVAALLFCRRATAQELTFSMETKVRSQYLVSAGAVPYRKPVVHTWISASKGNTGVMLWNSLAPGEPKKRVSGNEVDLSAWYAAPLNRRNGFEVGLAYFNLAPLSSSRADIAQGYLTLRNGQGLRPYATLACFMSTNRQALPGGWTHTVGIAPRVRLGSQAFGLKVEAGGHDGMFGRRAERIAFVRTQVKASCPLGGQFKGLTFTPDVVFQKATSGTGIAKNVTVYSAAVGYTF